jgi:hypothetical protein
LAFLHLPKQGLRYSTSPEEEERAGRSLQDFVAKVIKPSTGQFQQYVRKVYHLSFACFEALPEPLKAYAESLADPTGGLTKWRIRSSGPARYGIRI